MEKSLSPIQLRESDATLLMQTIHQAVAKGQFIRGRENTITDLIHEVSRARILPSDTLHSAGATLGCRVQFSDCTTGEEGACVLVPPESANGTKEQISILSPLGAALIGHVKDEVVVIEDPSHHAELRILSVSKEMEA